jgi:DNA-binding transcriptional LysR family regulator
VNVNDASFEELLNALHDGVYITEVDTLNAMKDVAAVGEAFTILPFLAVQDDVERGLLDAVRIDKPEIKRTIALAFTHQHPLSKAARVVGGYVRELCQSLLV